MRNYDVDTSNLYVGQIFWNYKQLCQALDEAPTVANSKKAQMKNWKRFFAWEQDGWAFTITAIYGQKGQTE